jgi:cytochrome oxidase Cu insertion factor (SCO1/SenC/PrrC family)
MTHRLSQRSWLLAIVVLLGAAGSDTRQWKGTLDPIGPFQLRDLDGKTWTDEDFKGKTLIVQQWAAACVPCVKEFPEVQKLYESLRFDPSIAFVTFDMDEDSPKVREWLREFRKEYTFPVILAGDRFRPQQLPSAWIVDRDGFIRDVFRGGGPGWPEQLLTVVEAVKHRLPVSMLPPEVVAAKRLANAREGEERN